jgi:hypothetical protein
MSRASIKNGGAVHTHMFLGEAHAKSESKTWAVIWLCGAMMVAEIVANMPTIRASRSEPASWATWQASRALSSWR